MSPWPWKTLFRLFTYQGSWTFERLQGIGMAFCIEPLLRGIPDERKKRALGRAASYFNTNPYFAGLVVGAVARAEIDEVSEKRIDRLRGALKGSLGSIGDRFIWSGVLPLGISLGLVIGTLWTPLVGVAAFLVVFNGVHLLIRWWALREGWRLGTRVGEALHRPWLQWGTDGLRSMAMLALGFAIPVLARSTLAGLDSADRTSAVIVAVTTYVVSTWFAPTLGAARIGLLSIGVGILVGMV
jgi:PTS system mannose-specific IID component